MSSIELLVLLNLWYRHFKVDASMGGSALVSLKLIVNVCPHKAKELREIAAVTLGGTMRRERKSKAVV